MCVHVCMYCTVLYTHPSRCMCPGETSKEEGGKRSTKYFQGITTCNTYEASSTTNQKI